MPTITLSPNLADLLKKAETQLFPASVREAMPPLYSNEDKKKHETSVLVKFFHPCSKWTWYVTEGSLVDDEGCMINADELTEDVEAVDYMFFGLVDGEEAELGYFSLSELMSIHHRGLGMERDIHWSEKTLDKVYDMCIA
jgi:hypothetical protein